MSTHSTIGNACVSLALVALVWCSPACAGGHGPGVSRSRVQGNLVDPSATSPVRGATPNVLLTATSDKTKATAVIGMEFEPTVSRQSSLILTVSGPVSKTGPTKLASLDALGNATTARLPSGARAAPEV